MTSLFNEFGNSLISSLNDIIEAINRGEKFTRSDVRKKLGRDFNSCYAADSDAEDSLIDMVFSFKDGHARCITHYPLPAVLNDAEQAWLADVLADPAAGIFLSPALLEKLQALFPDSRKKQPLLFYSPNLGDGDFLSDKETLSFLRSYVSALSGGKKVVLKEKGKDSSREEIFSPCRLEYNAASSRFSLILWNGSFRRIPLAEIASLSASDMDAAETEGLWESFLDSRKTSFTLRMKDTNNAIERCFSLFSSYDKESWREKGTDRGDDCYMLKIFYYQFDSEEILHKILSLGPAAVVMEPLPLRQKVIHILKEEYARFQ